MSSGGGSATFAPTMKVAIEKKKDSELKTQKLSKIG